VSENYIYFCLNLPVVSILPLGRLRRRWVDNIRMDLQEVGCVYMDWIGLVQDSEGGGRL